MRNRLMQIFDLLLDHYGPRFWWPAESPFEVCVGAILTQNTNWGNVEKAIINLKLAGILTPEALRNVSGEQLAEVIRPAGFFNVKSKRLKDFIGYLFARYDGSLEAMFAGNWLELRRELLTVCGIGPETGDSILLYAGHKPSFVVDAYTKRLFSRLGLIAENTPYEAVRSLFMENLAADVVLYNEYHALIVQHCKENCRKKPLCDRCPINRKCEYYRKSSQPAPD
jgi:endonuclease III related protein